MQEMHGARCGERGTGSPPSKHLHESTNMKVPEAILEGVLMASEAFNLHRHNRLDNWSLVIDSTSSPSPFPEGQGVGLKVPAL